MKYFKRSRFLRFVVLPLALLAFLPACYRWTDLEPRIDPKAEFPDQVRVTLIDGRRAVLVDATVSSDSLFGRRKGTQRPIVGLKQGFRVALTDVRRVERAKVGGPPGPPDFLVNPLDLKFWEFPSFDFSW